MSEEAPHRGISPWKVLDVAIVLIPFLGGLTLVIVAIAYESFYDVFNVRPADVGRDTVGALNRPYASLLGYSALFGIVITLGIAAWRIFRPRRTTTPGGSRIGLPVAAAYSIWLFAFVSQFQAPEYDRQRLKTYLQYGHGHDVTLWLSDWWVSVPAFLAIVAASIFLRVKGRYQGATAVTMIALNLLIGLVILMASAYKTGLYTAFSLLDMGPPTSVAIGPAVSWFSVPAPCVEPVWIGSEPKPAFLPTQDVVYMGDADGTILLLDGATGYIVRLPSNQLMLQEKPPRECLGFSRPPTPKSDDSAAP